VVEEHRRILEAYERQDLAALYETIRAHLVRQRERILAFFAQARVAKAGERAHTG
jgi:DNA-binding GntR family transcriptional regulator